MAVSDTLRGYRTQFLYTLHRIFKEKDSGYIYRPEGTEDLDIIKDGDYVETIQIKNHKSGSIGLSNLSSKGHTTTFFNRGLDILRESTDARLKLVSYGPVDKSLSDTKRLLKSLMKQYKVDASYLVNHFDIEIVDEESLYNELNIFLKEVFINANPQKEIPYLLQWISETAERQKEIVYTDLIRQLTCYNSFYNKQIHFANELGIRIRPLFAEDPDLDKGLLEEEFYQGVSVSDKHICAGLGVDRTEKELNIQKHFNESPVVIIHGMSGQGKSCLCYQFIKRNYPIAFEIKNCDSSSFGNICASIDEMVTGLQVPILLYLDVVPSNAEWHSLINSFAGYNNVRLLVSIREDDWHQHRAKLNTQVSFKDIHLELTEDEAKNIYNILDDKGLIKGDTCFEDVCELFSNNGALLEFVYYLTHGEKLRDKIVSQWNDLSDEDKRVVSYITITNYLGGRLNRSTLASLNDINGSILAGQIRRMSGEFFICNDDGKIDDLHPLRTTLLKDAIFENASELFSYEALKLYTVCDIDDAYLYLIRLMKETIQVEDLLRYVKGKQLSCSQLYGVVKALIWKGAEDYEKNNLDVMSQLRHQVGPAWSLFLPINFTEINLKDSIEVMLRVVPNAVLIENIINGFGRKDDVYVYLQQYLTNNNLDLVPNSWKDWWYASQIAYWTNCAEISSRINYHGEINVTSNDIDEMSTILLGFKDARISVPGLANVETEFIKNLRRKFFITGWSCTDTIEATVFTDYINFNDEMKEQTSPNRYLVRLLTLCRRAFPEKKLYCAKFCRDMVLRSIDVPDIEKRIPRNNLPLQEMHEIRSVITNLFTMSYQRYNRKEYALKVFDRRKSCANEVLKFCKSFESWWLKGDRGLNEFSKEYDHLSSLLRSGEIEKPRSSYNTLGYGAKTYVMGESGNNRNISDPNNEDALDKFHQLMNLHFSSLINFMNQCGDVIIGKGNTAQTNANLVDLLENLPMFQILYKDSFANYINQTELKALEEQERKNYLLLWLTWDAQLKGVNAHKSIKDIVDRYKQMKCQLINNVVSTKILNSINNSNLACHVNIKDNNLNIEIDYTSESEYYNLQGAAIVAIIEALGNYAYFSTQRLILKENFDKIVVKPYYKLCDDQRLMLENQFMTYSLLTCLEIDIEKVNDMPKPLPVFFNNTISNPLITSYNSLRTFIASGNMACNQIQLMFNSTDKDDLYGQELIDNYISKCRDSLLSLVHLRNWSLLREWVNDTGYEQDIDRAISIANRFHDALKKSDNWYRNNVILSNAITQIQNNDIHIKMALAEKNNHIVTGR